MLLAKYSLSTPCRRVFTGHCERSCGAEAQHTSEFPVRARSGLPFSQTSGKSVSEIVYTEVAAAAVAAAGRHRRWFYDCMETKMA